MSPIAVAAIAVPLAIKVAIVVLRHLTRRNEQRNAAADAANTKRVRLDTGTYVTGRADVVDEIVRDHGKP